MKNLILFLLLALCSFTAQAQITTYNNAAQNTFYGIGGYSFSQGFFQGGVRPNPDVVSGPSPQNDFSYTVSSTGGLQHVYTYISTLSVNKSITLQFNGNNIRKFGCKATAVNIPTGQATTEPIFFVATTNLGNIANQTAALTDFVGFNVSSGNENEYIVSVVASFVNPSTNSIAINNIMVGDNTPQNVALNFDGVNDYVEIPSTVGNFATNQDFTVSCWIKPDLNQSSPNGQFYANENDIITKRFDVSASVSNPYPFEIRYLNNNRTTVSERNKIRAGQWDGTNFPFITSTTPLNDGKWHHVAFVRESGNFKLYIDGVQEGVTVADNATGTTTNASALQIGRRANNQNFFKGEIDEVRILNIAKTQPDIQNERFCKNPDSNFEVARYNFSYGVPHDNNALITQAQDAVSTNHGTLNNFAKTGDASNFVTGQVKYVKKPNFGTINGSSWATSFIDLQVALTANTCNDLFDVYVAKQTYLPSDINNVNESFIIPSGMSIYGGFAGTEKSINQRLMALIHSTNKTTLSGDLNGNDTPFNFTINRTDNSNYPVIITGNNVIFDGFTVSGASGNGAGIRINGTNATIKNSRGMDNVNFGFYILGGNATISNCSIMGNNANGILIPNSSAIIKESLIANNGNSGIEIFVTNGTRQTTITNSTIASNANYGIKVTTSLGATSTNILKNTLIYGNAAGGIFNSGSGISNTITYSLVQGDAGGTNGNLNGNTVNPQFVSPLANSVRSDAGDYRLKDSSPCINVGDDVGVSPLDLDRNPRPKGGRTDMGAYESNVNMNEIISIVNGNWENNNTWNLARQPLNTDKVIINGHTVTVTTNTVVAKDLVYKTGAILRYLSGGLLRFGL
jgi:Concanavalin A-like lectin/glucanases superfamily/Right handed beta helix region